MHDDGHYDGHDDRHDDGHDDEHYDGHDDRHDDGHDDGHNDGHDDVHADDHDEGHRLRFRLRTLHHLRPSSLTEELLLLLGAGRHLLGTLDVADNPGGGRLFHHRDINERVEVEVLPTELGLSDLLKMLLDFHLRPELLPGVVVDEGIPFAGFSSALLLVDLKKI